MSNVLNEIQRLRLLLAKESNFDLTKAEKAYNFIMDKQPKISDIPIENVDNPDGIYFILSSGNVVHESMAIEENKRNSIGVGVKMGNRFANVALRDVAGGEEVALCQEDKVPCGSEQFFHDTFWKAMADWNGEANTNDMRSALNPDINLSENEHIPSVAQLHLILLNINEINKALVEAGGDPMKEDWYWSSTENNINDTWGVSFVSGDTYSYCKVDALFVRPSILCNF